MTGVILAAGKGTRIYPFSSNFPKPLLPILNTPLIEYQIDTLVNSGINDIIIVIGHLGFEITKLVGDGSRYSARISYVDQRETLGIAHAVGKLEEFISNPFILVLGDIYFLPNDLSPMVSVLAKEKAHAVLATKIEQDPESIRRNFSVISKDETNIVTRVIEKPRYVVNNIKGCGIYLFDLPIFDAIRRTPRTAMRDEYEITDSIQILIDDGYRVVHLPMIENDINLTYPKDIHATNMAELKRRGLDQFVGNNVELPPGCIIENSVVGNNVRIEGEVRISKCVIFSGSIVRSDVHLENLVITPERILNISDPI
ncbi:MAG: NTP transferase domain-containing protein [SAR324 cluster bacterium]|nr:NTP transferase domain-containing protein [SAR324 cluster bacterium]